MKIDFWATVSFHRDLNLLVWQPRGTLDDEMIERMIEMIEEAEDGADQPFNRYTDLSMLDDVGVTFDYIFRVSLYRRIIYGDRPTVKSAFYVTDRATAEIALTHAVVAMDSRLDVKVFLDRDAAAEWLGVSERDLELDR